MSMIAVRVSEKEKELIEKFAAFDGESVSGYLKKLFYEKLEDYEDMKAIKDYENTPENDKKWYSIEQTAKELGIDL